MSKLQKSAWFNLGMSTIFVIISTPGLFFIARVNAKGVEYLLTSFIVVCVTTPVFYVFYHKKSFEAGFDEREKIIYKRAFTMSAYGLAAFLGFTCFIPFLVLGGQHLIKLYYLPLIFMATIFTAQFIHSSAIIIQCALEEEDGK